MSGQGIQIASASLVMWMGLLEVARLLLSASLNAESGTTKLDHIL